MGDEDDTPPAPPAGGKGGVGTGVLLGAGAMVLGTGIYLGIQVFGSDGSSNVATPSATSSTAAAPTSAPATTTGTAHLVTSPGRGTGSYTCDASTCGPTYDVLIQGLGVAISHNGSPAAADAPSDAELVGVTSWDDMLKVTASCGFGETTGQAKPDKEGVFRIHLPLYQYGPCQIVDFRLKNDAKYSDGLPPGAIDLTQFTVTPTPTSVDDQTLQKLVDNLQATSLGGALDSKAVLDAMSGAGSCWTNTYLSDDPWRGGFGSLCAPKLPSYGFQVPDDPTAGQPRVPGAAVQINGLDPAYLDTLFGPDGTLPCGAGGLGVTVCPETAPSNAVSHAAVFQALLPGELMDQPIAFHLGKGATVTVSAGGAQPTVEVKGDVPAPYVVVRNQAMTVFVPGYEAVPFQVDDGPTFTPWPPISYAGPGGGSQGGGQLAAVQQFATQLTQSLASDDKSFAQAHLDPAVLQVFPTQCPAHLAAVHDPTSAMTVLKLGRTGTYQYAPPSAGGTTVAVPNVLSVQAKVTSEGTTQKATVHFGTTGDGYTWFADCGATP